MILFDFFKKKKPHTIDLTYKIALSAWYKPPTIIEYLKKHIWVCSTVILICICSVCFVWAKTTTYLMAQLTRRIIEQNHVLEQVTVENTRLIELQNTDATDVLDIAMIIQDILNTASGNQRRFLEKVLPYAIRFQIHSGIPASAMISQAIYESGYGTSDLAKNSYNYFGLKNLTGNVTKQNTVYAETTDSGDRHVQPFRKFDNPYDGFVGYYEFLTDSTKHGRYNNAFKTKNGLEFIKTILSDGYCPDSNYASEINVIIKRHKLDELEKILKESSKK